MAKENKLDTTIISKNMEVAWNWVMGEFSGTC